MTKESNVVLRGGPADGESRYVAELGAALSHEDVGGGSVTYVATDETEEHDGGMLRVYRVA